MSRRASQRFESQCDRDVPFSEEAGRALWAEFHESLCSIFEEQLIHHVYEVVEEHFSAYCSRNGKVIDRRLAHRIGVNPSLLCRFRADRQHALTRTHHFLALLTLCGADWEEVGFPSSQIVVLECLQRVFPTAQQFVGQVETAPPTSEELLALYFIFNSTAWLDATVPYRSHAALLTAAEGVLQSIANAECDHDEPRKIVSNPQIHSLAQLEALVERFGEPWALLREVFPFLVSRFCVNGMWSDSWGIF